MSPTICSLGIVMITVKFKMMGLKAEDENIGN